MNNETRPTLRVPAASLSDAALMADYRNRCRLTVSELAEIAMGTTLELSAKEEAAAHRSVTRAMARKGGW